MKSEAQEFFDEIDLDPVALKHAVDSMRRTPGTAKEMVLRCEKALSHLQQAEQALRGEKPQTRRKSLGPQMDDTQREATTISLNDWGMGDTIASISGEAMEAITQATDEVNKAKHKYEDIIKTIPEIPIKSDATFAAYLIKEHLKDKKYNQVGFKGAMAMHHLGYDGFEEPPKHPESAQDQKVKNFHKYADRMRDAFLESTSPKT